MGGLAAAGGSRAWGHGGGLSDGRDRTSLCHGFPECWYSWRHQLDALASAGYHAVAPDMRGYG